MNTINKITRVARQILLSLPLWGGLVWGLALTSCNEWLDVRDSSQEKETDIFKKYDGFKNALTGCYYTLADQNAYGMRLTMTDIESLANLWQMNATDDSGGSGAYPQAGDLRKHNYSTDNAKNAIKSLYIKLFNVVSQANMVLKYADIEAGVFKTERERSLFKGEAYAIRALCQMDILRLFGQLPQGGSKQVKLPYNEITGIDELPSYYAFDAYVAKLKDDLAKAESLLRDNDPACKSIFSWVDEVDDFFNAREFRLNYWAVKSLQARLALYLGEKAEAYKYAKEVLDGIAKLNEGVSTSYQFALSGGKEVVAMTANYYYTCPSEAIFKLSKSNVVNYASSALVGVPGNATYSRNNYYLITMEQFNEMFADCNTAQNNRCLYMWSRNVPPVYANEQLAAIRKYYYNSNEISSTQQYSLSTMLQVIPMIRLSEIYLIAIETTSNLAEANSLYVEYKRAQNEQIDADYFKSFDEIQPKMLNEIRREFFCEGHMFYAYKRLNVKQMMWDKNEMVEDMYILPLPVTEFDPAEVKK